MSVATMDTDNGTLTLGPPTGAGGDVSDQRLLGHHDAGGGNLDDHWAQYGVLLIPDRDDPRWRESVREAVSASGLVGRGGAGFPSARKWASVSDSRRRPMVVVNAMEGEPASFKDRALLYRSPHLVLDGAEVVAAVVGASEVTICVADDNRSAAASVEQAVTERNIAGVARFRISVVRPPAGYVTGEESALVSWLDRQRALPMLRIDKSVALQVARRPVVVHNAETLAQLALIARHGPQWFRQVGTAEAPGSTLVTISGAVRDGAVFEVALGTPLIDILRGAGVESELSGVLLGGYGGAWLHPSLLATPYAPGPMTAAGATMGVGVIVALPAGSCGLAETARIARYMAGQSAGQCGPCVYGLPAVAGDLEQLAAGQEGPDVVSRILSRASTIEGRGACRHPDGVVRLVRSALAVFADDARAHAAGRPCPGHAGATVMRFPQYTTAQRWAS